MQLADVSAVCFLLQNPQQLLKSFHSSLLDPGHFLLPLLGSKFPLDAATGMNGRVWINTKEVKHTIAVVRCIELVDPETGETDANVVKKFLDTLEL
jgi:exosome complex component RRP40